MPELPEVETYVRELEPELTGRTITAARVFWSRTIAEPLAEEFPARIAGLGFDTFERRGKYMLLGMSDGSTLIVHLRMTGKLLILPSEREPDKHTHVVMELDNGLTLHYNDPRKFGRIWLVPDRTTVLAKLGPEPLADEFEIDDFGARLVGRTAPIKALLLDQRLVAGVGNIYADEALFRAHIHPGRAGGSLTPDEIERLHAAVRDVLAAGIRRRGSTLGGSSLQNYLRPGGLPGDFQNEFLVFRRTGQPCLVCGTPIARIVIAQRSTHFCPTCQPAF
ncbi:MAG: bifunctional DNA-formamidopyrimidine glycosylase/DNA-(apurinic or apyrimidinic site) lyase [Caldilineaceae bacterium]|nr:bifunctional DNA-formamidopyrimidine glycosylase/DNA-(apurinic or apyrimidinic site) lyase [Caldilineaceae bacterium]